MTKKRGEYFGRNLRLAVVAAAVITMIGATGAVNATCTDKGEFFERQRCMKALIDRLPRGRGVEMERILGDLERKNMSAAIVSGLRKKAAEFDNLWQGINKEQQEMDRQLNSEIERARRDAVIRRWAAVLNVAAALMDLGAAVSKATGKSGGGGEAANSASSGEEVMVEEKLAIHTYNSGGYEQKIHFSRAIRQIEGNGVNGNIGDKLNAWARTVNSTSLLFNTETKDSIIVPTNSVATYFSRTTPIEPSSELGQSQGTRRSMEYDALEDLINAVAKSANQARYIPDPKPLPVAVKGASAHPTRGIASQITDVTPGVATLKSSIEVVTGKDPITGDRVPRWVGAAGLVAGNLPGGKTIIKQGLKSPKGLWKLYGKSLQKWINRFKSRGWTPEKVDRVVEGATKKHVRPAIIKRPRKQGIRYIDPESGKSVVMDLEGNLFHVGGVRRDGRLYVYDDGFVDRGEELYESFIKRLPD